MESVVAAAVREGAEAFAKGVPLQANPYSAKAERSPLHQVLEGSWTLGWLRAFEDDEMS